MDGQRAWRKDGRIDGNVVKTGGEEAESSFGGGTGHVGPRCVGPCGKLITCVGGSSTCDKVHRSLVKTTRSAK